MAEDTFYVTYKGAALSKNMEQLIINALQYYLMMAEIEKVMGNGEGQRLPGCAGRAPKRLPEPPTDAYRPIVGGELLG
jgi:hypothetical protein